MRRVREGFCTVPNPYNPKKVERVSLLPDAVAAFVFWTRDGKPLLGHVRELNERGYYYYFLYTITGYPEELESHTPSREEAVATFIALSDFIGKEKMIWRYDPVILSSLTDEAWHKKNFSVLARQLKGKCAKVIVSIIDPYHKTKARLKKETDRAFHLPEDAYCLEAYEKTLRTFVSIAEKNDMHIQACAEESVIHTYGISRGKCIDDELIKKISGLSVSPRKDSGQRTLCGCVQSKDIGIHTSCLFGCKYCYATSNLDKARKNFRDHEAHSPSMIGFFDVPEEGRRVAKCQRELF